jgi:hypothetical protein
MASCYFMIKGITHIQSKLVEKAYAEKKRNDIQGNSLLYVNILSFLISAIIVLFNKFILGIVYHHLTDLEKISTKSLFNISFGKKLSVALFVNSALITYFVEILGDKNYYGPGGFIYTESWVFIFNAFIPPLVWLIDPWSI